MKITVENNSQQVLDVLNQLINRVSDPEPLLQVIGKELVDSTKQRFQDAKDPDGNKWVANTQTTLDLYFQEFGTKKALNKKPLTGESGELQTTITDQVQGDQLLVGSPLPYAAMQQFGGTTAADSMIPGKKIPARPFLGISSDDEDEILEIVADYLAV
ncbi:MAG: phage virion morphogenesis protein [Oceanospirillaceae bacterium]|nr:phage virion morphogenesis protein [Oceanospirillaceae bacterium]|tara:strand:+ start:574 stop:1047 length:474 start_codon:yes stop_codon:yes gene_type:complete